MCRVFASRIRAVVTLGDRRRGDWTLPVTTCQAAGLSVSAPVHHLKYEETPQARVDPDATPAWRLDSQRANEPPAISTDET